MLGTLKIFLDSSSVEEADRWRSVIDGATTNPSILRKDGGDLLDFCQELDPLPVSVEACGNILADAKAYSSLWHNVVIKVPLLRPDGRHNLEVIRTLTDEGIPVNCTALFSLPQVMLAAKAGARYVSLFAGRIEDEGNDWEQVLHDCMEFLVLRGGSSCRGRDEEDTELIVGSIRGVGQVLSCLAMEFPPDILTIPPAVLEKMVMHRYSLETVKQFEADYCSLGSLQLPPIKTMEKVDA